MSFGKKKQSIFQFIVNFLVLNSPSVTFENVYYFS